MRGLEFVIGLAFFVIGCQAVVPTVAPSTAAFALVGTAWIAEEIESRRVLEQVQSTLTFESAERIVGSTGCNRYFAPLQVSGTALRIGMGGSTRRACPPEVMDQESRFLAALDAIRTYRRDGSTLLLSDEGGQVRLRLKQTDAAANRQEPTEQTTAAG
jgi:putative lipoprotein